MVVFAAVVFGFALGLAALRQDPVAEPVNLSLACLCALIVGLFVLAFHAKRETVVLPARQPAAFLAQCRAALAPRVGGAYV